VLLQTQVNLSTRNPFLPCTLGAPLIEVLRNFARGVHRVPVVDSEDPTRIVAMLTQTDANRFLATDPEKYLGQARAHASITDLGLVAGADKVVTVPSSTKAIDAFITMHAKGLSALAVVDAEGAFQGCLSATDLKLITDYRFQALLLPVVEFLEHVRKEEGRTCKSYRVWCIPTTPLQTVVKKLAEERVHRVFVVDPVSMKPLGVVSLTDIARIVVTAKA
jgi:CBS domain-containing protein